MADNLDKKTRSYIMSQIKGKHTKPELLVRKFLFANGFRYRLHVKNLPGKPDIVLPKYKTAILVNGCFWHGHQNCVIYRPPRTNADWWKEKIERNNDKDKKDIKNLLDLGYKVIVIWECELGKKIKLTNLVKKILR
jgi:DNA mismatch endonuclease (patch repair protein)